MRRAASRGTDHRGAQGARGRSQSSRHLPQLGVASTLLPLAQQYGGMEVSARASSRRSRMRQATEAHRRRSHARRADAEAVNAKKWLTPAARPPSCGFSPGGFSVSERRACSVVELPRATCRYRSERVETGAAKGPLPARCRAAALRLPDAYQQLRRKGWAITTSWSTASTRGGLVVRRRIRSASPRQEAAARRADQARPALEHGLRLRRAGLDGRVFRTLNIIDDFSRECVAIGWTLPQRGAAMVRVLERLRSSAGCRSGS